jgi:hypothetical protein
MKNMALAKEFWQAPPPGTYPSTIIEAEAKLSKNGATMLALTLQIDEPEEFRGELAYDYIITDGAAKGGGIGKAKLRGLGINVDSNIEIPDEQLAAQLRGQRVLVTYGNEPQMTASYEGGPYDKVRTAVDPATGKEVIINKLVVKSYARHNFAQQSFTGQHQQAQTPVAASVQTSAQSVPVVAPAQQAPVVAPVQPAPVQGQFPFASSPELQFPQPAFAQSQQFAQPQPAFPQGQPYAAPQPAFAPAPAAAGFSQQAPTTAAPVQAQVPWATPGNGTASAQAQASATEETGKGRRKRVNIQEA